MFKVEFMSSTNDENLHRDDNVLYDGPPAGTVSSTSIIRPYTQRVELPETRVGA